MPSVYSNHLLADESQYQRIGRAAPKNLIINGDFSIWQRGDSQTSSGYGSDDRWRNANGGTTKVHNQQSFTLGQTDVTNNPEFYSETVVTSVAGAGNFCTKTQNIESVSKYSGSQVTLSFWAKADAAKDIATEFVQNFGTGGSPSSAVTSIGVTTHNLTTSWQKFTATVTLPSVSGKTLGTNDDDSLSLIFWFDAGSNFDSRTNSLGQQSGTFDIANVQLEFGDTATDFEYASSADQLARCQRYFEQRAYTASSSITIAQAESTTSVVGDLNYSKKRVAPTSITKTGPGSLAVVTATGTDAGGTGLTFTNINDTNCRINITGASGLVAGNASRLYSKTDTVFIRIDAEL